MAIESEEILARIGLDMTSMQRNTQIMLDQQKKASLEYVGFWESALSKREVAEKAALDKQAADDIKANEASLARLKAFQDSKLAATKAFLEAQTAMYEEAAAVQAVAQGSVPAGWQGAAGTAAKDAKKAEQVEYAVGTWRHAGHAVKETAMIIGDIIGISMVVRVLRSVAAALKAIALIGGGAVSVIAAGGMAIGAALWERRQLNANFGIDTKDADKTKLKQHKELTDYIKYLELGGQIDHKTASDLEARLRGGDTESVLYVQGRLRQLGVKGRGVVEKQEKEHADLVEKLRREKLTPEQRLAEDEKQASHLQDIIRDFQQRGISTAKLQADLDKENLQILKDQADVKKDIAEQNKKAQEAAEKEAEKQKEIADLERSRATVALHGQADYEKQFGEYPTIEELARMTFRDPWSRRRRYSATALEAQRYLWDEIYQRQARAMGNGNLGDFYQRDMASIAANFQGRGMLKPDETMAEVKMHLANINQQIYDLRNGTQKVNITEVDSQ
jgi:hypothetical protein